jgi:N-acetylglucosaminyldiphosphoundecaprenol N-acetyl-beta-D-mannosaminyltransferase
MSAVPLDQVVPPPPCPHERSSTLVNGVRVDPVSPGELLTALDDFVRCGRSHVVHFLAADPTIRARRDDRYRAILNRGDLNVPDGAGVAWAARLSGHPARRLPGTEGMHLVADRGRSASRSHYLYGGAPSTLSRCVDALERTHPGVRILGAESPPFRPVSDAEVQTSARRMRAAGADIVWVGLGTPKQDVEAERLREADAAPIIACVGAAFDFIAGTKHRAPVWMQRSGLEWLHRLASEPARLGRRYLVGNSAFVAGVLWDRGRSLWRGSRP